MQKLKQNLFWIGMGLAAAVLVVGYMMKVWPLGDQKVLLRKDIRKVISDLGGDAPGTSDVEKWAGYKGQLEAQYGRISEFYSQCDDHLERWLPSLPADPPRDRFMVSYQDQIKALEGALLQKGVQCGDEKKTAGFNWEIPTTEHWATIGAEEKRVLKDLQKRFWVRERAAKVILDGNVKVSRILEFKFLRRLHDKLQSPEWESTRGVHGEKLWLEDFGPAAGGASNAQEYEHAGGLVRSLTFAFAVELPYSEVPKFIQEFLNPASQAGAQERLLVNVTRAHATIAHQNDPWVEIIVREGDEEKRKQGEEDEMKKAMPRDVVLVMHGRILDLDRSKLWKSGEARTAVVPPANPQ